MSKCIPKSLIDLLEIPGIGPKTLKLFSKKFHIQNRSDLEKLLKSGEIETLPHFGKKSVEKILEGIDMQKRAQKRISLGEAYVLAQNVIAEMKKCKEITHIEMGGSLRRMQEDIGDIDILATGKSHAKIIDHFVHMPDVTGIIARGTTKASVFLAKNRQVDLRVVPEKSWGAALQYFTGSKQHNVVMRTIAKRRGLKVSEYGVFRGNTYIAGKTEKEVYDKLNMQLPPPEIRIGQEEIKASLEHDIPALIESADIKGDLHVHSNWSDGANNMEDMIKAAIARGYEYIAISDHSPAVRIANGLSREEVSQKLKKLQTLRGKYKNIHILMGTEVDILKNGDIDYDEKTLALFDVVIAAIHSGFTKDNTERLLKAMEHPRVHAIAHPTGRKINSRKPYPVDLGKIFAHAAKTKTALEINAHPARLDLKDLNIKEARKHGVQFVINTDAHQKNSLWMMELGVGTARRGWLTKKEVINALTWEKLQAWLRKKS